METLGRVNYLRRYGELNTDKWTSVLCSGMPSFDVVRTCFWWALKLINSSIALRKRSQRSNSFERALLRQRIRWNYMKMDNQIENRVVSKWCRNDYKTMAAVVSIIIGTVCRKIWSLYIYFVLLYSQHVRAQWWWIVSPLVARSRQLSYRFPMMPTHFLDRDIRDKGSGKDRLFPCHWRSLKYGGLLKNLQSC